MLNRFASRHAVMLCALMLFCIAIVACMPRNTFTPPPPVFMVLSATPDDRVHPTLTAVPTPLPLDLSAIEAVDWDIYDADPNHLWNRILRHFYSRTMDD